jgi:hypothetical protein
MFRDEGSLVKPPSPGGAMADLRGRAYLIKPSALAVGLISGVSRLQMIAPGDKKKTNPGKLALFSSVPARANPLLQKAPG